MQINVHEAKTHLSKLIKKCQAGEEIIIAKQGEPIIKLVSLKPTKRSVGFFDCEADLSKFDDPVTGMEDYLPKNL
ncbi:MAG: type II toxin-antitoxin system prevent-host-death family antitoxin [Lentisphaeraceae bacterium]|nr:type II toxin-antitoxin system prevent-host-death family antitoxin [Lentisphaeraceae bacterium]